MVLLPFCTAAVVVPYQWIELNEFSQVFKCELENGISGVRKYVSMCVYLNANAIEINLSSLNKMKRTPNRVSKNKWENANGWQKQCLNVE